jgi:hypothetical protein
MPLSRRLWWMLTVGLLTWTNTNNSNSSIGNILPVRVIVDEQALYPVLPVVLTGGL